MKRDEEMAELTCETCKHYTLAEWDEPCRDCKNSKLFLWEPVEMEERTCDNCRHFEKKRDENPCRNCSNSYTYKWKPAQEAEEKKRTEEDTDQVGVTFQEFKKRMREAKESSPKPLPMPVCISGPEDGRLPELIRIAFDDGTTAVYRLKEAENDQLIIKSIEIIRKWNRPRRRRDRQQ